MGKIMNHEETNKCLHVADNTMREVKERIEQRGTNKKMRQELHAICNKYFKYRLDTIRKSIDNGPEEIRQIMKNSKANIPKNPFLYENEKEFGIIGSKEALKDLGELLIMKAKILHNIDATMSDNINKPIRIQLDTELLKEHPKTQTNPILDLETKDNE